MKQIKNGSAPATAQKEKHYVVIFSRVYEIPESEIIERMNEIGGFTGRPDEDETEKEYYAEVIASDLISEEMNLNTGDIENFFHVEISPSLIIY